MRAARTVAWGVLGAVSLVTMLTSAAAGAPPPATPVTASAAPATYPVRWDFLADAIATASKEGPNVAPAGSNVPCRPSAQHPDPVVLVHGLAADQNDDWGAMSPFLADNGYCVFSFTYGNDPSAPGFLNRIGGLTDMTTSAHVLATFVQWVLGATGATQVDLVGHSEGATMPDWYLKFDGGNRFVAHFVLLSGVIHGTTMWGLSSLYVLAQEHGTGASFGNALGPVCSSCLEFLPSSSWMRELDAVHATPGDGEAATCPLDGAAVDGVAYTSIATENDELVRPPTSDFINPACASRHAGISVDNILLQRQCPQDQADHLSVEADPNVAQDILNALDPAQARPVQCSLVLPSVG